MIELMLLFNCAYTALFCYFCFDLWHRPLDLVMVALPSNGPLTAL